ncbi:MAG: UDP-3-O-(3-hydroxymyristoyl)glucosamine N-acyltransferase [Planctomycetota bacterium]
MTHVTSVDQDHRSHWTAGELADRLHGTLHGPADVVITGIEAMSQAQREHITLISSTQYAEAWSTCDAGAAVVSASIPLDRLGVSGDRPVIVVDDAEIASADILSMFDVPGEIPAIGVHPSAVVDASVVIGKDVRIGCHVSVAAGVTLGDRVVLMPGCRIGAECTIGSDSALHENVVLYRRTRLGQSVRVHANTTLGADGFGYRPAPDGSGMVKMPHIGSVIIDDRVEIGPNTLIARGKFGPTSIGEGTKIDGGVSIAHNVTIGCHCVIAGNSGVAGSVRVGNGVIMGAAVKVRDHITIGDGARVGGNSVVAEDVEPGTDVLGTPALPGTRGIRQVIAMRKLPDLIRDLKRRE